MSRAEQAKSQARLGSLLSSQAFRAELNSKKLAWLGLAWLEARSKLASWLEN